MPPLRRTGFLTTACACFVASAVSPLAHADQSQIYRDRLLGDLHAGWTIDSMNRVDYAGRVTPTPLRSDEAWLSEYQEDPASIYSGLAGTLGAADGDYTPRTSPVGSTADFPYLASINRMVAWNLGLYKALPTDMFIDAVLPSRLSAPWVAAHDTQVRANLFKAGVDPQILAQAQRLSGPSMSALGAELAIAVTTLAEWSRLPPEDTTDVGIRLDVLGRFRAATSLTDLTHQDLAYLADILRLELSIWRGGQPDVDGKAILPAPLRIARAAAAHHGGLSGYAACRVDGRRDPAQAGAVPEDLSRPICFTDATDRAVYRWYRALRAQELAKHPTTYADRVQASRLMSHFADVRGAWAGAYAEEALEWSNHAEILDAQMLTIHTDPTLGIEESDVDRVIDRASRLICRRDVP